MTESTSSPIHPSLYTANRLTNFTATPRGSSSLYAGEQDTGPALKKLESEQQKQTGRAPYCLSLLPVSLGLAAETGHLLA